MDSEFVKARDVSRVLEPAIVHLALRRSTMQMARVLARPHFFSLANVSACRKGILNSAFHAELGNHGARFCEVRASNFQSHISRLVSAITSRDSRLTLLSPVQSTVDNGRNFGRMWAGGLAFGSTYFPGLFGQAEVSHMDRDEDVSALISDVAAEWDNRRYRLAEWIRRLWIPSLCLLTIAMGWQYPMSLLVNVIFLMWSTKPTPSSIYMWVEERRQQEAWEKRGFDRVRAQVSGLIETSAVMHVEVRDYKLFCLARVTSLTKKTTTLGLLGDWWVICSSTSGIHTRMNVRNLMESVTPFVKEQFGNYRETL